jgi:sulfate permease, SulP family
MKSAWTIAAVLALAPFLAYLPMASLAALLLIVAWNMSERHHFVHIVRVAPKSDVLVLLTCFSLTVVFDMVISVSVGIVLAALLFMRRMADISSTRLVGEHPVLQEPLPRHVLLYEIAGPLFFGAAQKAVGALDNVRRYSTVILYLGGVPAMDVTGLVALESVLANLKHARAFVILAGVREQPLGVLAKAGIKDTEDQLVLCATLEEAVELARARPAPRRRTDQMAAVTGAGSGPA